MRIYVVAPCLRAAFYRYPRRFCGDITDYHGAKNALSWRGREGPPGPREAALPPGRRGPKSHQPQDFASHMRRGLEGLIRAEKASSHMGSQQQGPVLLTRSAQVGWLMQGVVDA